MEEAYNHQLDEQLHRGFRALNRFVMDHTCEMCTTNRELSLAISASQKMEYVVHQDESIDCEADGPTVHIIISRKRTFEAAQHYVGRKITLLNFANNHSVGGAPWSAGAQEESLCRCSTLYPCLKHLQSEFYDAHREQYGRGEIDEWGNDDLIYTPGVIVFKSDESAPKILPQEKWFAVNVITGAAPQLSFWETLDEDRLSRVLTSRIEKILRTAKKEGTEVLILGAFGCGAFHNPPELVAKVFKNLLGKYRFETVEFAIFNRRESPDNNFHTFERVFRPLLRNTALSLGPAVSGTAMSAIRRAGTRDIPEIDDLLNQVNLIHHLGRPDLFKLARKYTDEELAVILQDDSRPVFVAVDGNDRALGYAFCIFQQHVNDNLLTDVRTLYIDDLCVQEQLRGQHIGRALFEHVLAFARENGCHNVTLNVWALNAGARKFYEKCGMHPQKIGMETIL